MMNLENIERANLLGVGVSVIDMPTALAVIEGWIERRETKYVYAANVHTLMECQRDVGLRRMHNHAGLVTPDGMPLVWACRWLGHAQVQRVYGPDLMLAVCQASAKKGYRHFFYGGAPGVAEQLAQKMAQDYPGLVVAGAYSPPFRRLSDEEDVVEMGMINAAQPDILWVGLGAPKQERWAAQHRERLTVPVILTVGAAFDFHVGTKKQAPLWMQRSGLEWFYRLLSEPRRLWRRYLILNPWFIWKLANQLLGIKQYPLDE